MKVYRPYERPDVEVLVDGVWCPGELRAWKQVDGEWRGEVQYRPPGETSSWTADFAAGEIREDTVDRSKGRGC